jgi:hypothetical protein
MQDLLKAISMYQDSVQAAATTNAVSDASRQMASINEQVQMGAINEQQQRQALQGLSNQVALNLLGTGADAQKVQSAFAAISPQNFGSAEQLQLEGSLSGNKFYNKQANSILEEREARSLRKLKAEEAIKLNVEFQKGMMDIKRDLIKSGMKPAELKPEDVAFQTNIKMANKFLDNLDSAVGRSGTWESGIPFLGNKEDRAILEAAPYQLAITYAKIVDPNSVAREGEVAAAQKYLMDLGPTSSKDKVQAQLKNMRDTIQQYQEARASSKQSPGSMGQQQQASEPAWQVKEGAGGKRIKYRRLANGSIEVAD